MSLNEVSLEGDILVPGAPMERDEEEEFNTLDEPIRETVVSEWCWYGSTSSTSVVSLVPVIGDIKQENHIHQDVIIENLSESGAEYWVVCSPILGCVMYIHVVYGILA